MKVTITKGKAHFEQFTAEGSDQKDNLKKLRVAKLLEALAPHVGELKVEIPDGAIQSVELSALTGIVKALRVTPAEPPYEAGKYVETVKPTAGETHWGEKVITRSTSDADEAFLRTHAPSSYSNNQGTL